MNLAMKINTLFILLILAVLTGCTTGPVPYNDKPDLQPATIICNQETRFVSLFTVTKICPVILRSMATVILQCR